MKNLSQILPGHWVHSHEEDKDAEMVFRPAHFSFPPSRGRKSFELKPDGQLIQSGIGPTDRRSITAGTWKLEEGDRLAFYDDPHAPPRQVLQIKAVQPDRLVVAT